MKHLILGNGAAGITAAEKLRELNPDHQITIIGPEGVPTYSKCMLPDYVGGKLSREKLFIRSEDSYKGKNIRFIKGKKAARIDIEYKKVILEDGSSEEYDRLLVATGAVPLIPPVEGLDNENFFIINSYGDAESIIKNAVPGQKALIIGAGLTGMEMAFSLTRLGMEATIVVRGGRLLSSQLDSDASCVLMNNLIKEGIKFIKGTSVSRIYIGQEGKQAEFTDGQVLPFDMLLLASGTTSNIDMLKESGLKCSRGVLVDEHMKASANDVFAAGDVAEALNSMSNGYVSCYIWSSAMAQGQCAAYNMSGIEKTFSNDSAMLSSVQMRDTPFISSGLVNPTGVGYEVIKFHDASNGIYKKLVISENRLLGMTLIGDTSSGAVLGSFLRKGADISEFKDMLLEPDFSKRYKEIKGSV